MKTMYKTVQIFEDIIKTTGGVKCVKQPVQTAKQTEQTAFSVLM